MKNTNNRTTRILRRMSESIIDFSYRVKSEIQNIGFANNYIDSATIQYKHYENKNEELSEKTSPTKLERLRSAFFENTDADVISKINEIIDYINKDEDN